MEQIEAWIQEKCSDLSPKTRHGFVEDYPTLFCRIHPAAEEVELSLVDPEHLVASANTSTVGPGYHIFLCSILKDWARDFQAEWQLPDDESEDYRDEAEYFFTGDQTKVFEHMTSWLQTVAGSVFEEPLQSSDPAIALSLSLEVTYESEHMAITPLGPRDREWLREVAEDGSKGKDFFAWWQPGLNAEYFLTRSLTQMWTDVRWRSPVNDSEREVLRDIANSLEIANKLEPKLEYPWAEWSEVLEFLGARKEEIEQVRSKAKGRASIGYRREKVTLLLPSGWSIRLPGSFSEFESDADHNLFALDPPNEIWFTSYQFTAPSPHQSFESRCEEIRQSQSDYLHERDNYISKATVRKKTGEACGDYFVLNSSCVSSLQRAVCTIVFPKAEEREWALEIWRSIQPPQAASAEAI